MQAAENRPLQTLFSADPLCRFAWLESKEDSSQGDESRVCWGSQSSLQKQHLGGSGRGAARSTAPGLEETSPEPGAGWPSLTTLMGSSSDLSHLKGTKEQPANALTMQSNGL